MNNRGFWVAWPMVIVGMELSACTAEDRVSRNVGGHTFSIPRKNILEATISYLPASQNRGLRFVINPEAPRDHRILVSIDPQSFCPGKVGDRPISSRCRAVAIPTSELERDRLRRASGNEKVWWEYRLERAGTSVAACTALAGESDGLCTSYGLFGSLPYTVHFRDTEIGKLVSIRKEVERDLAGWEVRRP